MLPSKNKPKILFDEHMPLELIKLLSEEGFNTKRVPLGINDEDILELAKSERRLFLTSDKHFLNKSRFPPKESEGIVFINIHPPFIDELHFTLNKFFNSVDSSKFKGRLFKLTNFGFKAYPKLE